MPSTPVAAGTGEGDGEGQPGLGDEAAPAAPHPPVGERRGGLSGEGDAAAAAAGEGEGEGAGEAECFVGNASAGPPSSDVCCIAMRKRSDWTRLCDARRAAHTAAPSRAHETRTSPTMNSDSHRVLCNTALKPPRAWGLSGSLTAAPMPVEEEEEDVQLRSPEWHVGVAGSAHDPPCAAKKSSAQFQTFILLHRVTTSHPSPVHIRGGAMVPLHWEAWLSAAACWSHGQKDWRMSASHVASVEVRSARLNWSRYAQSNVRGIVAITPGHERKGHSLQPALPSQRGQRDPNGNGTAATTAAQPETRHTR